MSGSQISTDVLVPGAPAPALTPQPDQRPATPAAPRDPGDDPDRKALDDARAAVVASDAEKAARKANGGRKPAPTPPAAAAPAAPGPIMVPKARLDETLRENQLLRDRALYFQGVAEARATPPAAQPATPAAPKITLDQAILAQQARVIEAAKKFDTGELSMEAYQAVQNDVSNRVASMREQALMNVMQSRIPTPSPIGVADQHLLNQQQLALEAEHPWLVHLSNGDFAFLKAEVEREQAALGHPIEDSPAGTMRLRHEIAERSDFFGPRWYPNLVQQQPADLAPGNAPPSNQQARQPAASRGLQKIALAAEHPPNLAGTGAVTDPGVLTSAQIENMSTDEIAALPQAVRARLLSS